jgi:membrane protease YdiL (CAAX protease family)
MYDYIIAYFSFSEYCKKKVTFHFQDSAVKPEKNNMTIFQLFALLLVIIWLVIVALRFRRSTTVLIGGLFVMGIYILVALVFSKVKPDELGLGIPDSWIVTSGWAFGWLVLMLAYSRLADKFATRWAKKSPNLEAFRIIQQSKVKLVSGIIVAWLLGGILEELIARGIVLKPIAVWLAEWLPDPLAAVIAVCIAAFGAGIMHFYQGPRAMIIITQLSLLFGVLFVISGYNLWSTIFCHGLYDTIAFIRFANKKSKYSDLDRNEV